MVNFIESLKKGIDAAQKAEENREEINSVFRALNEQLHEAFEGKVEISTFTKSSPFSALMALSGDVKAAPLTFLGAINPLAEHKAPKELARWKMDPNGYPCQIITSEFEFYCENKQGLENGLQELLSSPIVGEHIYKLIKLPAKPETPF
ncbi:hypothetical protein H4C81_19470 [Pseudomonas monteilii]|uniref:hypothetical protein n=1 Tax=Pseudomonas monteilii TaxID=76759 RepID=UPI0015FE56F3|nr:hypothetical protein [Pseudomonas monteilii]MBA6091046.1 hypothetical protein [Pseudomonas monteilii]